MKKILLLFCLINFTLILKSQDTILYSTIYDFEDLFTVEQEDTLRHIMYEFEKNTNISTKIITSNDYTYNSENDIVVFLSKENREFNIYNKPNNQYLSDDEVSNITSNIFPETLSKEDYYSGVKEFIIQYQEKINLDLNKNSFNIKIFLYFILFLVFLFILYLLALLRYKFDLKKDILELLKDIKKLKEDIKYIPSDLQILYDSKFKKLKSKDINKQTKDELYVFYDKLCKQKQVISNIDNYIDSIDIIKKEVIKYIDGNYPYCKTTLNDELLDLLAFKVEVDEYNSDNMNKIIGTHTTLERRFNIVKDRIKKLNLIIDYHKSINEKLKELKDQHDVYINKRKMLSGLKIGKRLDALDEMDFEKYLKYLPTYINKSFQSLTMDNINDALYYYGSYISTTSVIIGHFSSINTLLSDYNNSKEYINNNLKKYNVVLNDIEGKLFNSSIAINRRQKLIEIKSNKIEFDRLYDIDVIKASEVLKSILISLDTLLSRIRLDIVMRK
jgi:hypothetical protein